MGHYFILDREATFAVAVKEALEEKGHSAEIFQDTLKTLASLVDFGADALILDLGITAIDERRLVGTFREVPATRSLPIVGLAESGDSDYAVRVLQLGLTDVLPRALPLAELIARITRTVGRATIDQPMMQGRLAGRQLVDFLEYLRHMGKSGNLLVTSTGGGGRIELRGGGIAKARFKNLRGDAAVLAMLDQETGKFKFEAAEKEAASTGQVSIQVQQVLLRATWLSDKLAELKQWIPRSGDELELNKDAPALGEEADSLPLHAVLQMAKTRPFIRLHELTRELAGAPQEIRLALAVLLKTGHLRRRELEEVPSTKELKSFLGVEFSMMELLQRAKLKGHRGESLTLVGVCDAAVLSGQVELFRRFREPFGDLAEQLEQTGRASASVKTEAGMLVIHYFSNARR